MQREGKKHEEVCYWLSRDGGDVLIQTCFFSFGILCISISFWSVSMIWCSDGDICLHRCYCLTKSAHLFINFLSLHWTHIFIRIWNIVLLTMFFCVLI